MVDAAILDCSEVKFDVPGSNGRPVSTSTPNLVKISEPAAVLWRFMCFQNGSRPPFWIFAELKFGGISVSGTSVLVSVPNFVRYVKLRPSYGRLIEFSTWRPLPSWNYFRCRFFSYRRFWIVVLYVLAKFDKSISFCGWVIEVCPKIQDGGCPPSGIIIWLFWTTHEVFLLTWSLCLNFVSIGFIFAKISPIERSTSLA